MHKIGEVSIDFISRNYYGEDIPVKIIFHNAIVSMPKDIHVNRMQFIDELKPGIKIEAWESADLYETNSEGIIEKKEESHFSKGIWYDEEEEH